jgi:hypothetical protein
LEINLYWQPWAYNAPVKYNAVATGINRHYVKLANFTLLTKLEQLQKVYDILLGARNTITLEITLTIAGNIF